LINLNAEFEQAAGFVFPVGSVIICLAWSCPIDPMHNFHNFTYGHSYLVDGRPNDHTIKKSVKEK